VYFALQTEGLEGLTQERVQLESATIEPPLESKNGMDAETSTASESTISVAGMAGVIGAVLVLVVAALGVVTWRRRRAMNSSDNAAVGAPAVPTDELFAPHPPFAAITATTVVANPTMAV
jgi:hypothetical protein